MDKAVQPQTPRGPENTTRFTVCELVSANVFDFFKYKYIQRLSKSINSSIEKLLSLNKMGRTEV